MTANSDNILIRKQAIMNYLQLNVFTVMKFINWGLPVRVIDRRYYAHTEYTDLCFQDMTAKKPRRANSYLWPDW